MSVLLLVLKILGWTVAALLALIVLALFIPVSLLPEYAAGRFTLHMQVLCFKFGLYDSEKQARGEKADKKRSQQQTEEKKEDGQKKKSKLDAALIRALLKPAAGAVGWFLRSIRIDHVRVRLVVRGADAAQVGIRTGKVWQGLTAAILLVRQIWRPRFDELSVLPDFLDEYRDRTLLGARITALPICLLAAAVLFLVRFMKYRKKYTKAQSAADLNIKEKADNECKSA